MKAPNKREVYLIAKSCTDATNLLAAVNPAPLESEKVLLQSVFCQIQAGMLYDFVSLVAKPENIGPKLRNAEGKEVDTCESILDHTINVLCGPIWKREHGPEFLLESKRRAVAMLRCAAQGNRE